jgi:hypothetical protein
MQLECARAGPQVKRDVMAWMPERRVRPPLFGGTAQGRMVGNAPPQTSIHVTACRRVARAVRASGGGQRGQNRSCSSDVANRRSRRFCLILPTLRGQEGFPATLGKVSAAGKKLPAGFPAHPAQRFAASRCGSCIKRHGIVWPGGVFTKNSLQNSLRTGSSRHETVSHALRRSGGLVPAASSSISGARYPLNARVFAASATALASPRSSPARTGRGSR